MLKEARDGTPNAPLIRYHLGRAYNAVNVKPLAKEELEKALELAKDAEFPQRDEAKKILKQMESEATQ